MTYHSYLQSPYWTVVLENHSHFGLGWSETIGSISQVENVSYDHLVSLFPTKFLTTFVTCFYPGPKKSPP
jgi:hypothetical protein